MNRARLATFFLPYLLLGTTLGAHIPAYGCDEDPIVTSCSQALKEGVSAFEHRDYAVALASLLPLAEAGVPRAQTVLGRMYLRGQGVPPDSHRALTLFRKAADQGLRNAQNNLAGMYAAGKGVPQDYQEAIKWFRKAADQDYALAMETSPACTKQALAYDQTKSRLINGVNAPEASASLDPKILFTFRRSERGNIRRD